MSRPGRSPTRLNVAISTLRSALDPKRVITEDDAVRLRLDETDVDIESFLADAETGMALLRTGRLAVALPRLTRPGALRRRLLEEDIYQDWAVPVREQARAACLEVAAVAGRRHRLGHQVSVADAGGRLVRAGAPAAGVDLRGERPAR